MPVSDSAANLTSAQPAEKKAEGAATLDGVLRAAAARAENRLDLWTALIDGSRAGACAEIGVFRGDFAQQMLERCPGIETYYLVDPWRHLSDWNKPANIADDEFRRIKAEALERTQFAESKRRVLEGKTTEVADSIPNESLDFAYIDGDHTLRGITIDLARIWPKMKRGGLLGGDDFCETVWQHGPEYEPTLVFPLAVYFAEGMGCPIYALPFQQFAIVVEPSAGFEFFDLTGRYRSTELRKALSRRPSLRRLLRSGGIRRAIARIFPD